MTDPIDIEDQVDEFDIQVEDDAPPEDQNKPPLPEEVSEEEPTEEEIAGYSARVKSRIEKLTRQKHDERRRAEALEREIQAGAQVARQLYERVKQYEAVFPQYEKFGVDQGKARVEVQIEQAKTALKEAFEKGDADGLANAQADLARLVPQHEQFSRYQPATVETYTPPPPIERQPEPDPRDTERFKSWQAKNDWFGQDEEMTSFARGWHLTKAEKDPGYVGSPEYYEEIGNLVRKRFPEKFNSSAQQGGRKSQVAPVAPVVRQQQASGQGSRKSITLTQSQVRLAQRLGLTPEQYARELVKMERS
jgi:hypothetical protein